MIEIRRRAERHATRYVLDLTCETCRASAEYVHTDIGSLFTRAAIDGWRVTKKADCALCPHCGGAAFADDDGKENL